MSGLESACKKSGRKKFQKTFQGQYPQLSSGPNSLKLDFSASAFKIEEDAIRDALPSGSGELTPGPGAAWPPAESPSRLEERSRLVTHAAPRAPGRRPQFRAPPRRQDAKPGTTHFRPPLAGIGRATRGRFGEQTFIVMWHMDQNGQNGESGGKNEGGKMLLEARLYRAGHAAAHGTHPRAEIPWASCCSSLTCREEWRVLPPGCPEEGRPVRRKVYRG
ncbi:unnamed protein product [Rangifer tarandus platyrhynchus]|uniref:Uncharacterized protein n=2 Tax=Rangifer tarandus platyrhynchus TaxID=3082113 RepID=A0ABN8Z618_RANTA|nr:unnamed protein product [Rangifer tarandus platyrhynchus]